MPSLPADVISLICEELGNLQDFGSLFGCAMAGRTLAYPALRWLYRIHNQSPVITSEGNDAPWTSSQDLTYDARRAAQRNTISKWALMWKSITLSSLGATAYPYCHYIRVLDLRNLSDLLHDPVFRDVALDTFFTGDMTQFLKGNETPVKMTTRAGKMNTRLSIPLILDAVGESITNFVSQKASKNRSTVALEDLSGDINDMSLPIWVGRLSNLRSMNLWNGSVLDKNVAVSIANQCHNFDDLTFYLCPPLPETDQRLASFFSGLRANSLKSFTALNAVAIGPETLLSLNHHARSLRVLKLDGLTSEGIKNLPLLQACDALEHLDIHGPKEDIDLEATDNDVFLGIVEWLKSCKRLRDLRISCTDSGPTIAREVCLQDDIHLLRLVVHGYRLLNSRELHEPLSLQTSLESLDLKANAEWAFYDDKSTLINAIRCLRNLKDLKLISTTDEFRTRDIIGMVTALPALQELWFTGHNITDDIWPTISNLHDLRALNILGFSSFSRDGILNYISTLQDSNRGLNLAVLAQNPAKHLTEEEQASIRQSLVEKVDGKFEYAPHRESDSDSESLSD